jgi:hypothetical protein
MVIYSQIWLNLPEDDCHFFYIFLWMVGRHFGYKQKYHWSGQIIAAGLKQWFLFLFYFICI